MIAHSHESLEVLATVFSSSASSSTSESNLLESIVHVCKIEPGLERQQGTIYTATTKSAGSGILLTADGWVLTAYHNIEQHIPDWKKNIVTDLRYAIIDQERRIYPLDTRIYHANPDHDLALIKAITRKQPARIPFTTSEPLRPGDTITVAGMSHQQLYRQAGRVTRTHHDQALHHPEGTAHDTFTTTAEIPSGISGGIFLKDYALAGIVTYRLHMHKTTGPAGGIGMEYISPFIDESIDFLTKNITCT